MNKYICIHGHFYQPPRENPWLNEVEIQVSAFPYHDWNQRITEECYARNSASRILNGNGNIVDIMNNYAWMSFNFGPTLLEWMQKKAPDTYQAILDADKESIKRFSGHGSAVAQVYNHIIMPLANPRDKQTQVVWGIYDFKKRFNRDPEGMWLAETAADTASLEVLAAHGIKYTILSPFQARRFRKLGDDAWTDAEGGSIDTKRPYLCRLPSGRSIALFFYNAPVSQGIAFERLLNSGEQFAHRLTSTFDEGAKEPQLMHIATDGETYGHHHRFGEMALSYALHHIEENDLAKITVYGEYLEKFPPEYEAEILEETSWSCAHGIERWRTDCGCNTGASPNWDQAWRAPLRSAFDWLRDALAPLFEHEMQALSADPWRARDAYIQVIMDRSEANVEAFVQSHTSRQLGPEGKVRLLKLLEMEYHTLLLYTSCGWFFDEVTGIETVQDIFYAARALQLAQEVSGNKYEPEFLKLLAQAHSNIPEEHNAAQTYQGVVKPAIITLLRVGAHYAISSLFADYPASFDLYCYQATSQRYELREAGRMKMAVGQARIRSKITWDEVTVTFGVLHLGDHQLFGGVRQYMSEEAYRQLQRDLTSAFEKGNFSEVIMQLDKHFASHSYSFWHLFKDDQQKILDQVLEHTMQSVENDFQRIYDNNYTLMLAMKTLNMPLPRPLQQTVEFIVDTKLQRELASKNPDVEEIRRIRDEAQRIKLNLDTKALNFAAAQTIDRLMQRLNKKPDNQTLMYTLIDLISQIKESQMEPDYWQAQNIAFRMKRTVYKETKQAVAEGAHNSGPAAAWCAAFEQLYNGLNLKA